MSLAVRRPDAAKGTIRSSSPLNDQGGHIDAGHILPEILDPVETPGQAGRGGCADSDVPTSAHDLFTDALS